jgi:transposase
MEYASYRNMTTHIKPDWREQRRLQGLALKEKGWQNARIAEALGVSQGAVSQWFSRYQQGGREALLYQPPCGAPSKLSDEQLSQLPGLLLQGPESYGFTGQVWTSARVSWLIKFKFNVSFHRAHVCRILKKIGWSVQKPVEKATQRDEAAIKEWSEQRWPHLKKKPRKKAVKSSG